ncbi:recombinase family protein [Rhodococcus spelaei]|uniref:Recombinase family protein n=1 Tax=Rhodococcus spelaei TaxID=2546320 RepID=A0A541BM11_9NOCA|nr:recombinase family protein [Rhodococcus spelaei]TQF73363.1 recombinase family protein [Rhodococcus spelaei]
MTATAAQIEATEAKAAVSYIRVSTKEQAERDGDPEGYSIPAQRDANRRKAASIGAVVIEEFVDRGESARSADRPELKRMLAHVKANQIDFVIVHKVDRLARNRVDDVEINLALRNAGATLVSATENIDETASGMLLHGIMSSIAEFYSRNLAAEVNKGMEQKAKTGGTPGKAPLGYRNVGALNPDGREVRTVAVDPERAPLITWAFQAYATGDWTLKSLTAALEDRGLTTVPTPKRPASPIKFNSLHKILTTPYYKGDVTYRGVNYPGRHLPLIDEVTWARVQDVLSSHATGEKQREHPHYLKSSVFCGGCGSRLIVTMSKNRYGTVYPYFICMGRHQKVNGCTRKAVLIDVVEELVEDVYRTVQLAPEIRGQVEAMLRQDLQSTRDSAEAEQRDLTTQKERLTNERARLLQAHYAGAVPLDLLKTEQDRIARHLANIEDRLVVTGVEFETIEQNLRTALAYASNCYKGYLVAGHHVRRLYNQAFFERIFVDDDQVRVELSEPFSTLMGGEIASSARRYAESLATNSRDEGAPSLTDILSRDNKKPSSRDEGLKQHVLVPPAGIEPAT